MSYESKPGDAALFLNDKKTKDTHPDRRGYIIAHRDIKAGEKLELAMWLKKAKSGAQYLIGKVSDPRERGDDSAPF